MEVSLYECTNSFIDRWHRICSTVFILSGSIGDSFKKFIRVKTLVSRKNLRRSNIHCLLSLINLVLFKDMYII